MLGVRVRFLSLYKVGCGWYLKGVDVGVDKEFYLLIGDYLLMVWFSRGIYLFFYSK